MTLINPFPDKCAFHFTLVSDDVSRLHPIETIQSQQFKSEKRKREFVSGRSCAQIAMSQAGFFNLPITKNQDRSPGWPTSIIGSISHSHDYAAAMVAYPGLKIEGVGIDIEDYNRKVNLNISKHVLNEAEIEKWINDKPVALQNLKTVFSIKESIFKCYYPKHKIYLGFHDAEVVNLTGNQFTANLLKCPNSGRSSNLRITGNYQITNSIIFSSIIWY